MTSENRNSQSNDWLIGEHIARNRLYRRGTKSVVTSPGSPDGPARLLLPVSRSFPFLVGHSSPSTLLPQLLPSHPSILRRVRVTHTRIDTLFAGTIRAVSVRAEACKQVRWMHSVHSTRLSSSSSITSQPSPPARVCPSFFLSLSFSVSLSRFVLFPHVLSAFSVSHPSSTLVSFSYFGAHCNRAFSVKTYGFLCEESSPAIVLPDAADDRNLANETRHRTISRITMSPCSSHASCAR